MGFGRKAGLEGGRMPQAGHYEVMRPPGQASLPQLVGGPEAGILVTLSLAGRPLSIQISVTSCFNPSFVYTELVFGV